MVFWGYPYQSPGRAPQYVESKIECKFHANGERRIQTVGRNGQEKSWALERSWRNSGIVIIGPEALRTSSGEVYLA